MVVIPPVLRKEMLMHLHSTHLSTEHMRSLSRLTCWWPTINTDIDNFVKTCDNCKNKKKNSKSDWKAWPLTYEKMQRIHADYAGPILGYYFLIIVDSYSKWPEVYITKEATSNFTQRCLRTFFSREGIPQVIVTDNGSHFVAENLRKWFKSLNVTHITSAPRHPKSNGLAENFVKTLKYAISAVQLSSLEELECFINNFLFHYRNCEHSTTKQRPSVLFRGHVLRSQLIGNSKVTFKRGNDLRLCNGIILKNLGGKMVLILDSQDGSVHRRHVEQLSFVKSEFAKSAFDSREAGNTGRENIWDKRPGDPGDQDATDASRGSVDEWRSDTENIDSQEDQANDSGRRRASDSGEWYLNDPEKNTAADWRPSGSGGRRPSDSGGRRPGDSGGRQASGTGGRQPGDTGGRQASDTGGRKESDPADNSCETVVTRSGRIIKKPERLINI